MECGNVRRTFRYRRQPMAIILCSIKGEKRKMNNTTKINILANASEPDKNYNYDGDFVEYKGKVYWVSLRDELVEFVRNAKKKEV